MTYILDVSHVFIYLFILSIGISLLKPVTDINSLIKSSVYIVCDGSKTSLYFILKDAVIYGSRDEDVTLRCDAIHGMAGEGCFRGRWIKTVDNSAEVILYQRDKWKPGEDMPLKLSKLRESDEGLYSCEIWKGWESVHIRSITLKLKGKNHLYI